MADAKPVMPEGFLAMIPNAITASVVASGSLLMMSASVPGYTPWFGVVTFWVGFIADILDGWTARKLNVGTKFGAYFDELADLTAFGIGPAVFYMRNYMDAAGNSGDMFTAVSGFLYMLASVFRISRELVVHRGARPKFFVGLPTNGGALVVIHAVYFFPSWDCMTMAALVLLVSVIMAVPVKILKDPTGIFVPFKEQWESIEKANEVEKAQRKNSD